MLTLSFAMCKTVNESCCKKLKIELTQIVIRAPFWINRTVLYNSVRYDCRFSFTHGNNSICTSGLCNFYFSASETDTTTHYRVAEMQLYFFLHFFRVHCGYSGGINTHTMFFSSASWGRLEQSIYQTNDKTTIEINFMGKKYTFITDLE